MEPEGRKTVTVLFCDLVAYTELAERLDPEALRLVMSGFFELARTVIERHGGTVEKFVGDEVMAVFGVPLVREDDALRAVRAATALRELLAGSALDRPMQVRIGINTGEVVVGDPAPGYAFVTGEPVALAKRLEQVAAPGEILLGARTHRLLAHAVQATSRGPLRLKGKRDAVGAFRLDATRSDAPAVPRRDDVPLVEREPELRRLRDAFDSVVAGGARVVTVVGEPGLGKSRLVREFAATLTGEARILVGRCPPYGEGITFTPLRELVLQLGRDESELGVTSREVFGAAQSLLAAVAREQPVVVVFDDVHWAEPTFLDLIEYLGDRLDGARVLVVCLARPELAERRPAWLREPAHALSLGPLSQVGSESLLEALGVPVDARAAIAEAAEGNPLFVEQLAALAGEDAPALPASIRGVLAERLDRLSRDERSVLERAAVIGRSFSLEAVEYLTPTEQRDGVEANLLALVRQRLVQPELIAPEEGYRFQHSLIREAAYESLAKATRARLHELVAARLETAGAEHALVGFHLEQAYRLRLELDSTDVAIGARGGRLLRLAAQEAFGRSDLPATIALLARARALLPPDDAAQPVLLTELGYARIKAGDFAGAETDLDEAIERARRAGDRAAELHARVERQFARAFAASSASASASLELAQEALQEFEQLGDELGLARAWWLKADGEVLGCRWRERAAALEHALEHARRADTGLDFVSTLSGLLAQALLYGPTPAAEAIARTEQLRDDAGSDRALRATVSTSLAGLLAMQGSFDDARRVYADAVAAYEELGLHLRRASHRYVGAQIELLAGDAAAAERELRASTAALTAFGARNFAATHGALLAQVLCALRRWDEAEAQAREVGESAPDDDLWTRVLWQSALATALVQRGRVADAEPLALDALALTESVEFPDLRVAALACTAEVETARQRLESAERLLGEARDVLAAKGNVVALALVAA